MEVILTFLRLGSFMLIGKLESIAVPLHEIKHFLQWIEINGKRHKKSNNHGNFIPISIVSFHYHFLFFFAGSSGIFFSISRIARCEAIFFLLLDIIPKTLTYHLIPHLSCMLKYAFNIIPSVLMEQLMMILIFIEHTHIHTQIHMLTMNNFTHFNKEVCRR